jgi:glycosyltransferase involved in cell wall biosynthesis
MPTADRRRFVPQAIRYFEQQDYPNRELLVIDDGADRIEDLVPERDGVRYIRPNSPMLLGAKRNLACRLAAGEVICHWDDDDWSAPERISNALATLQAAHAQVCGSRSLLYFSPSENLAWRYEYPAKSLRWLAGNTLIYRREAWSRCPFPEIRIGEDSAFTRMHSPGNVACLGGDGVVGIIHDSNTSPKKVTGLYWRPHPIEEVQRILGSDLEFYRSGAFITAGHQNE